jgi:hypothetical protein
LALHRYWDENPYSILACVETYGVAKKKVVELSLSEEIWFYNTITVAGTGDEPPLVESRAAMLFTLVVPKIPHLWADVCHATW